MIFEIAYKRLHEDVSLPIAAYGTPAGWDISAYLISESGRAIQMVLPPRTSRVVPTGLILLPPPKTFLAICSRSGAAAGQNPIFVANAPGIIDPDYTGELKVILFNGGHESAYIKHGDRIAQIILLPHLSFSLVPAAEVPSTERGAKGFGSSGTAAPET